MSRAAPFGLLRRVGMTAAFLACCIVQAAPETHGGHVAVEGLPTLSLKQLEDFPTLSGTDRRAKIPQLLCSRLFGAIGLRRNAAVTEARSPTLTAPSVAAPRGPSEKLHEAFARQGFRLSLIGGGGEGQVYLAEKAATGEKFIVKLALAAWADPGHEANILDRLSRAGTSFFPHHLPAPDFLPADLRARTLVTDSFGAAGSARTLKEALETGALDLETRDRIALSIVAAVGKMHDVGIVHRDLKPENILVDEFGNVRLIDFGVSGELSVPQGITSPGLGSLAYMDARSFETALPPGTRQDVHALGLVLHQLFTGTVLPNEGHPDYFERTLTFSNPPLRIVSRNLKTAADKSGKLDPKLAIALTSALPESIVEYRRLLLIARVPATLPEFLRAYGMALTSAAARPGGAALAAEDILFSRTLSENFPDGLGLDRRTAARIREAAKRIRAVAAGFPRRAELPHVMRKSAKYGLLDAEEEDGVVLGPNPHLHYDAMLGNRRR